MIIALHGFLGLPSDWQAFDSAFEDSLGKKHTIRKWDLYSDLPAQPPEPEVYPLRMWAQTFCERIERGWQKHGESESQKPVLMGYSMGGRLALHALLESPNLFSGAIIIGAHPGLQSDDLKMQRRLNDARWADRVRTDEWSTFIRAWGEQDVFTGGGQAGSLELRRHEGDFDRVSLSRAMQLWSLANQQNLRAQLGMVRPPTLWISGEKDRRFRELYADLRMDLIDTSAHEFAEIPQAGHRAPWDNPDAFIHTVQDFLKRIS